MGRRIERGERRKERKGEINRKGGKGGRKGVGRRKRGAEEGIPLVQVCDSLVLRS